ncbi:MAG TPA: helix-turn-helix domain-containing protein [Ktedonobacterales bacterium]
MPNLPKPPNLPDFFNWLPRFGDQLRDGRTLRGLTVEQIAEAVGVAPSAIRDMETGQRPAPSKDVVRALADALHLTREERANFLEAAEMSSPFMQRVLSRKSAKTAPHAMTAAILVFVIADIRGYTRFTEDQGDEAAARLTARFADLTRAAVERWDGQLVEVRGDEVLSVFASARQALHAAHDLLDRYAEERDAHPELPSGIGVGIDVGESVQVDDGYRGAALNRAARLCALAGPGEVLVSTGVAYVAPQVDGVSFVPRGQEQLKGFTGPVPILLAAPDHTISVDAEVEAQPMRLTEPPSE